MNGTKIKRLVLDWLGGVEGQVGKVMASGARIYSDKYIVATRVDTDRKVFLVDSRDKMLCNIIRSVSVRDGWSVSTEKTLNSQV